MSVLVTGGAGFIGSHLCEALLDRRQDVVALDNFDDFYDPAVKRSALRVCLSSDRFRLIEVDVRDREAVDAAVRDVRPDVIVHLAAKAGVRPSIERPVEYQDVNVGGTNVLLEAARRFGVSKFIFASSSSVYGNNRKVPFAESDNVDFPISPYAATKRAGELMCHVYHKLFGIDVTCLRFFTVYGPRQRPDLAIHKFTRLIEAGEPIEMFGDGSMMRDHTYIDDTINGVLSAIDRCEGYRVYNLGQSRPVRLSDLIAKIEAALGKKATVQRLPVPPGDVEQTFADLARARAELGYDPQVTLEEGLRRFVVWFRRDRGRGEPI